MVLSIHSSHLVHWKNSAGSAPAVLYPGGNAESSTSSAPPPAPGTKWELGWQPGSGSAWCSSSESSKRGLSPPSPKHCTTSLCVHSVSVAIWFSLFPPTLPRSPHHQHASIPATGQETVSKIHPSDPQGVALGFALGQKKLESQITAPKKQPRVVRGVLLGCGARHPCGMWFPYPGRAPKPRPCTGERDLMPCWGFVPPD